VEKHFAKARVFLLELLPSRGVQNVGQGLNRHEIFPSTLLMGYFDGPEEINRANLAEGQSNLEFLISVFATVGERGQIFNFGSFNQDLIALFIFGDSLNFCMSCDLRMLRISFNFLVRWTANVES
jgi:hypothetical protein